MSQTEQEGRLGFVSGVRSTFGFLRHYNFGIVRREPTLVRFENEELFLQVSHGRLSYGLEIVLGRLSNEGEFFTLPEAVGVFNPDREAECRFQSSTAEGVGKGLQVLASLVQECCEPLLANDRAAYVRLATHTSALRKELTLNAQYGAVRDRADLAWREKDYQEAFRLYSEMEEALTVAESRRFSFLRQKVR